jgi:diguanylate cyclase (GGDEF)-like protein/PAS domain S-box-containing protein
MDLGMEVGTILYLAAALQVAAAVVALLLIPVSGMRKSWIVICLALILQAYRRVDAVRPGATLEEALTALAVSVLLLIGIVSIRAVFVSLKKTSKQLDEEVSRDRVVVNRAGAAIVMLAPDGTIGELNDAASAMLGVTNGDVVGTDWFAEFVPEKSREAARSGFERLVGSNEGNDEYVEYPVKDRHGRSHSVVWHRRLLRDAAGQAVGVRNAGVDMTDSTLLERDLAFRSLLLDHTNDSVLAYRLDGVIVYANSTACAYRGTTREEMIGANVRRFVPARDLDALAIHLETMAAGSSVRFETEAVDREGIVRPLESQASPVLLAGERLVVEVSRDVTDRREAESATRRLAFTDSLTGLANRVRLQDRASVAIARARRSDELIALLFMDLDRLKAVNDTIGHAAGDELLRQVGERLRSMFREEDAVARVGGDEFVGFARVDSVTAAETVASRLVAIMEEPFAIGGREIRSSASVGVAVFPVHGDGLEELMARADAAMYAAKDRGRDRYCLYEVSFEARTRPESV